MSFSKAKLQRFNDVKTSTLKDCKGLSENPKIKPISVLQCDKSTDKVKSETASSQSVPCFRTPTFLKKKLKGAVINTALTPNITERHPTNQNFEALKEKIVECENKDAFIKDLSQQLDELKERINQIQKDKDNIEKEKTKCENLIDNLKNKHENHLQTLQNEFQHKLVNNIALKDKISEQLTFLKEDFQKFQNFYATDVQDLKNHCSELPVYFEKFSMHYQSICEQKQAELDHQKNIFKMLEQSSKEMEKQHTMQMEKLKKEQQIEIQNLEFEMLNTMTNLQREKELCAIKIREMEEIMNFKIAEMQEVFEKDKEVILYQSEIKIKELQENCKCDTENTTKLLGKLELEWKTKLKEQENKAEEILKECQAISEYNIIQCTVEKNAVINELKENNEQLKTINTNYKELTDNFKDLESKYEKLKSELYSKKAEVEAVKKQLHEEIEQHDKKLKQISREKSAYEFTIKNSQITIDVLTKRLINSDRDVEQLKEELLECEKKLLDYEQKNLQLSSDLKQTQVFNEELEMQFESTIKLNCKDVENIGAKLFKEVADYKNEVGLYKKKFKQEEELRKEIMLQLHDAYHMVNMLKEEFKNVETVCNEHKFEVQQSQNELEDYHMREMDWNIIKDKLESTVKDLEDLLESKTHEITDLKQQILLLEHESDSLSHCSDYYKEKVRELELEQSDSGKIHKKYIELSGKYDYLSCKYEELEAENLENKMILMKLKDVEDFKVTYDTHVILCNDLEVENEKLKRQLEDRLKEECLLKSNYQALKAEKDTLLNKLHQLENERIQCDLDTVVKPKSKKIKDDEKDSKKLIKKNKHPKGDKENVNSPNRTLNSSRIDSPLRDRN